MILERMNPLGEVFAKAAHAVSEQVQERTEGTSFALELF